VTHPGFQTHTPAGIAGRSRRMAPSVIRATRPSCAAP
jgi:ribosome modulation factor